jgi:hypothetical protein
MDFETSYITYLVLCIAMLTWVVIKKPPGFSKGATIILWILAPLNILIVSDSMNCGSGCGALLIHFFLLTISLPAIFGCSLILLITLLDSKKYFICQKCGEPGYLSSVITEKTTCAECKKTT